MDMTKTNAYISERIAIISMYLDRWMIEKEIELVVARWKNTFKSFSGYTHVIDENFKIYHANYASGKSTGEHCYKVLAGRDAPCESCPILKNKNSSFFLKKDQFVKTYFSQFKFQEQKYYFVIYEDITKINQLHSQIIQTEKMSTLGRLGNHLAHELNNPLTGMKSYVQTVLQDQEVLGSLPSTATSDLSEILKAAVRCQKIIKNFIEFSQKKEPVLEEVSFNEVLQNTLVLLKTALRNHRLFIDLKDDKIKANAHDLQQVLFNLIKNSCQAMKTPGSIKIYLERRDKKLFFNVEDSGPGFDSSVLENIFQPFMTTKAQGEGTGLGLYLSKKLINNMHADMQVSSSAKGAKISLIFDEL
jgi:signal transduction histidine kinase